MAQKLAFLRPLRDPHRNAHPTTVAPTWLLYKRVLGNGRPKAEGNCGLLSEGPPYFGAAAIYWTSFIHSKDHNYPPAFKDEVGQLAAVPSAKFHRRNWSSTYVFVATSSFIRRKAISKCWLVVLAPNKSQFERPSARTICPCRARRATPLPFSGR
eukprot:g9027.t1